MYQGMRRCCELLSDFLVLLEHKQHSVKPIHKHLRCELLSDFLVLLEHKQLAHV